MEPREHMDERGDRATDPNDTDPVGAAPLEGETSRRRGNRHHTSRRRGRGKGARADGSARTDGEARDNPGRLQGAMASGRTPGSRAADDPGTVPLGTDDEAAGTRASAEAVETEVARAESGAGRQGLTAHEAMSGRAGHPEESPRGFGKLVTAGAVAVLALIVLFLLL